MLKTFEVWFGTAKIGTYKAKTAKLAIARAKETANADCNAFRKSVAPISTNNATAREVIGYGGKFGMTPIYGE